MGRERKAFLFPFSQSRGWGVGEYFGFQVTGRIEWDQISKPKKIPKASNKTPKKFLDQKLTTKKSHAEFLSLENLQKGKQNWLYLNRKMTRLGHAGSIMF